MKLLLNLLIVLGCTMAFAQKAPNDELFARITPDGFQIVGDRQKLGNEVSELLSKEIEGRPDFEYSVIKGTTAGEQAQTYFAVILRDARRDLTVARWLEARDSGLYLVREFANENYWQVMTLGCVGERGCAPMVTIVNAQRQWSCGTPVAKAQCRKIAAVTLYD